jgi:Bacterial SH3 domain
VITNFRVFPSVLRAALLVALLGTAAFAQDATVTRNVNMRSEPTTASPSIRLLNPPEKVTLVEAEASSGYYHVKTEDGAEGWVWGRNIRLGSVSAATSSPSSMAAPNGGAGKAGPAEIYPDSVRTPGAPNPKISQANIANNICKKGWSTTSVRPPTSVTGPIKDDTMTAYGFADPTHYELDHLESLQVGGCPDCETNLWPEAYGDVAHPMTQSERAKWNRDNPGSSEVHAGALEKDKVENHVHDEICFDVPNAKMSSMSKKFPPTVSVTLERGQEILAKDWYGCYLNMLQGNKPCQ